MRQKIKNNDNYLIKQLPKATAYVNLNLSVAHISDSWLRDFNLSLQAIEKNSILGVFPTLTTKWKQDIDYAFLGYKNTPKTDKYFDSSTSKCWLEWTILPWYDEAENIIGAIIQIEDVTKHFLLQQKLEKLEILITVKSQIAKIGSWEYDAINDELKWSDMTKIIHEVPNDYEPNTDSALSFYKPGKNQEKISKYLDQSLKDGLHWSDKFQIITGKGKEIWVIATGKPLFEDEKFVGIIGTFQDITEDVKAQQKTKESENLLRTLIDHLPLNVFVKDLESKKILVNQSECDYLNLTSEELIGKSDFDLYDHDVAQVSRDEDLKILSTLEPMLGVETINIRKDGKQTNFLTSKIPLFNEDNDVVGLIGFSLDITQIKQKEEQLTRLINVSALQNKKLLNFAHIVSHNLRSHTANFSMLLGFLIKEKEEQEREKLLSMLIGASDNLLETIDNLNEVLEINSNPLQEKKNIHANTKIDFVKKNLHSLIKNKGAHIINNISNDVYIKGVPTYVNNILISILSNAIKFGQNKTGNKIELSADKIKGYTILVIKDNGIGIDLEKNKDKIFGMYKTFHQLEKSRGVSLYIARNQIEAMNGKFVIASKVGQGTTFKIYFNEND
ncbi:PAS domain-containing sensor histidine kinase [Cellulophaga baltica]|uniref:histidine kinase n=1 Tax=Cellulophaga baltica TaxID=76594 RepID=A0A1G7KNS1_9FLAO|nr:PAS domain-containing sensor histidine kinase [Cellulophaga baltica]SDF38419.1 PAS domain S-box-containing protein [Cellulophaga baltica]